MNCGTCGTVCAARTNAAPVCAMGACTAVCVPGFADCDGDASTGCESSLDSPEHCGACRRACVATTGTVAACVAGRCELTATCPDGQSLCGGVCRALGASCSVGVGACARAGVTACGSDGTATCNVVAGAPSPEVCDGVDNDCDGATDEGWCRINGQCLNDGETNSANRCQRCAVVSASASGPTAWSAVAADTVCRPNVGPCDLAERCDGSGAACPADRFQLSTVACRPSSSVAACDPPEFCSGAGPLCPEDRVTRAPATEVCDGADNNCDGATDELPAASCAAAPNATTACASGACRLACNAGFGDCDANVTNGCEAPLSSTAHCGGCGRACSSGQVCDAGRCVAAPPGVCPATEPTAPATNVIDDEFTSTSLDTRTFTADGSVRVESGQLTIAPTPSSGVVSVRFSTPATIELRGLLPQTNVSYDHFGLTRCGGTVSGGQLQFLSFESHWEDATVWLNHLAYTPSETSGHRTTSFNARVFHTYRFEIGESEQRAYIDETLVQTYSYTIPRGTAYYFGAGTVYATTPALIDWLRVRAQARCSACS